VRTRARDSAALREPTFVTDWFQDLKAKMRNGGRTPP